LHVSIAMKQAKISTKMHSAHPFSPPSFFFSLRPHENIPMIEPATSSPGKPPFPPSFFPSAVLPRNAHQRPTEKHRPAFPLFPPPPFPPPFPPVPIENRRECSPPFPPFFFPPFFSSPPPPRYDGRYSFFYTWRRRNGNKVQKVDARPVRPSFLPPSFPLFSHLGERPPPPSLG